MSRLPSHRWGQREKEDGKDMELEEKRKKRVKSGYEGERKG